MNSNTDRPSDQEILDYEREIKNQTIGNTPMVGNLEGFASLEVEYQQGVPIYLEKIETLKELCSQTRSIKKDGNCFYRAFGFRLCEIINENVGSAWHSYIIDKCEKTKDILTQQGYDMSILEDFYEPFNDAIHNKSGNILNVFTTEYLSDTIVCYLRIVTAAILKRDRLLYESFVLSDFPTLDAFISACVEPMNVESDQIHIVAMANAFGITVKVPLHLFVDTTPSKINFHEISSMEDQPVLDVEAKIALLYRPGHYDILYLK
ncbi:peptidase C65 Otubain-domain-containing protein [Globomyces pollinis-pini]|nr:peptidase C65 Otubain-domain-containing protein [Globomyces pollinis-pini]